MQDIYFQKGSAVEKIFCIDRKWSRLTSLCSRTNNSSAILRDSYAELGWNGEGKQASSNRLRCRESHPENRSLNPFICGTICWPHSVGNGYTKSTENCRVARHRNQIKPDALKVTNAPKCESQADVHERLRRKSHFWSVQGKCHTPIFVEHHR